MPPPIETTTLELDESDERHRAMTEHNEWVRARMSQFEEHVRRASETELSAAWSSGRMCEDDLDIASAAFVEVGDYAEAPGFGSQVLDTLADFDEEPVYRSLSLAVGGATPSGGEVGLEGMGLSAACPPPRRSAGEDEWLMGSNPPLIQRQRGGWFAHPGGAPY